MKGIKKTYKRSKKERELIHKKSVLTIFFASISKFGIAIALFFIVSMIVHAAGLTASDNELNYKNQFFVNGVSGNVGIGTANPSNFVSGPTVHIKGATPAYTFEESDWTSNNKLWDLFANAGQFRGRVLSDDGTSDPDWLMVRRKGATVSSVNFPNGNVGIGTTNPTVKLDINGDNVRISNTNNATLTAFSTSTNSRSYLTLVAQAGGQREWRVENDGSTGSSLFQIFDANANADRITIDSSGKVGIGTTSPDMKLHIGSKLHSAGDGLHVDGVIRLSGGVNVPNPPVGSAHIWLDSADGALKVKFSNGVVKKLATPEFGE